jgi:hypothetical protein
MEQDASLIRFCTKALTLSRRVWGDDHRCTVTVILSLVNAYWEAGDYEGAKLLLSEAWAACVRTRGEDYPKQEPISPRARAVQ